MATSRPSRGSRARYTSPIPPAPSGAMISYGPSFVPEVRAIRARHYIPNEGSCSGLRQFRTDCFNAEFSEQSVVDAIGTGLRVEARRKVADDRAWKQHLGDGNVVNRVMLAL